MIFAAALALALAADLPATATPPAATPPPAAKPAPEELFQQALAAQQASDWPRYRELLEATVADLHDASRLFYRLAGARLLTGDRAGAIEAFRRQVDAGIDRDPRPDPVFAPLADDPAFRAEVERMLALREPLVRSTEAFRLDRGDLVEGIAVDLQTGSLFLSSVRERRILRRTKEGVVSDFVPSGGQGLRAALGIAVDTPRRLLWVVSAGLPHAAGLPAEQRDRSTLLAFHIDRGTVEKRIDAPAGDHLWNDLEVAPDGTVYASDPAGRAIHRVAPDGSVSTIVEGQGLRSPGGLALSPGGAFLYVADWTVGLAVVEVATGALQWLKAPPQATTVGIDGLRWHGRALIAIQNGVSPARVQRFEFGDDGRTLGRAETLERAHPGYDEPTLGVVLGPDLWYVANSQWPKFGEDGALAPGAELAPTLVLRLPLR